MTCPLCQSEVHFDIRLDGWTVCLECGVILIVDRVQTYPHLRQATPEEFLALVEDTRTYGMLLLLQDEIKTHWERAR